MKFTTTIAAAGIALIALAQIVQAGPDRFDIAEDMTRFVFAEKPVFDDGLPAYGNTFVTEGYIYPAGTLDGGIEGTLADGSPTFPNLVIGKWICDGVFVADGMHTDRGTLLISRQTYLFNDGDILISHGPEKIDVNQPFERVITGGIGDYAHVGPVLQQTFLGMSDGYGVRLQIALNPGDGES